MTYLLNFSPSGAVLVPVLAESCNRLVYVLCVTAHVDMADQGYVKMMCCGCHVVIATTLGAVQAGLLFIWGVMHAVLTTSTQPQSQASRCSLL